jgi:hypothetical protein
VRGKNVQLPALKEPQLEWIPDTEDALLRFYRRLLDDVMPLRLKNLDLDGYFRGTLDGDDG